MYCQNHIFIHIYSFNIIIISNSLKSYTPQSVLLPSFSLLFSSIILLDILIIDFGAWANIIIVNIHSIIIYIHINMSLSLSYVVIIIVIITIIITVRNFTTIIILLIFIIISGNINGVTLFIIIVFILFCIIIC